MRRSIKKGHKANIVGKKVKFNDEKSSESVDDVEERSQRNSQSTKTFKKLDDDEGIDKEFDEDFELDEFEQMSEGGDGQSHDEYDEDVEYDDSDGEGDSDNSVYEEEVEDEKAVVERRRKLPKTSVDDRFFNLAEMEQFCNEQEAKEENSGQQQNLGSFKGSSEISRMIKELEEENLHPREWDLQGEVTNDDRQKDELLRKHIEVDFRAKNAPKITPQHTEKIEEMIKKRIKDNLFDDVVRKVRIGESLVPAYRNKTPIEETVRKSLAEVYGDKMSKKLDATEGRDDEEKLDPQVEAIKKNMDALFKKLDALSHFQFRPPEIVPEAKIVNNMASFRVEEVGPTASTEANAMLLAPEEVFRRVKAAPMAKEERTQTDKKRERRKKKKRQKVMANISQGPQKRKKEVNISTSQSHSVEKTSAFVEPGTEPPKKRRRRNKRKA